MPQYTQIVRSLSPAKFVQVLGASARQARETFFHRHAVRAPKTAGLPRAGAKNEARALALFAVLGRTEDDELAEEVLRNHLLGLRPLLVAALEHLEIPHADGLTDSDDVARIGKLSAAELRAMVEVLLRVAERDDVMLYLRYMGAENLEAAVA